jgi:hypothetical protein
MRDRTPRWRGQAVAGRGPGVGDRIGDLAAGVPAELDDGFEPQVRREGERLPDVIDRAARDSDGGELALPEVRVLAGQGLVEQAAELIAVGHSCRIGGEVRILGEGGQAESVGEARELAVVPDCYDDRSIGGPVDLVRRDRWMGIAHAPGHVAGSDETRGLIDEGGQQGGEQGDLDQLPDA